MISDENNIPVKVSAPPPPPCWGGDAVVIRWDADKAKNEDVSESSKRLSVRKWNPKGKHSDGSWRFDLGLES